MTTKNVIPRDKNKNLTFTFYYIVNEILVVYINSSFNIDLDDQEVILRK